MKPIRNFRMYVAACGLTAFSLAGCATSQSTMAKMSNEQICTLMTQNPNSDFDNGQQVLMSRNAGCTQAQYQYISYAQQRYMNGMAALGAYGQQMQANSYRQVAPALPRPITCQKVGYTTQCF